MAEQSSSPMPLFRRAELAIAGLAVALLILCSLAVILLRLFSAKDTFMRAFPPVKTRQVERDLFEGVE